MRNATDDRAADDRIERLAGAILDLARKIRSEGLSAEEFSGARLELIALRGAVASRGGLNGLDHALAELDAALSQPAAPVEAPSRPAARRVRARRAQLDASTRRLLRRASAAVAATTLSAAVAGAPVTAAAECVGGATVTCTGVVPDSIAYGSPVSTLILTAPSDSLTPAAGAVAVSLDGNGTYGGDGSDEAGVDVSGGGGGWGGVGRTVHANVDTTPHAIVTNGADGVRVLSNGGNGGEGGAADGAGAFGGDGGRGGAGGEAHVTAAGSITTSGADAHGIFGQSAGGIGGDGGNAKGIRAEGGDGNIGGAGGYVGIANSAKVTTSGEGSMGVFGQSVGGRGGHGGNGGGLVAGGGGGSDASNGGSVAISNSGAVTTSGDFATGLFGQSVGGYGGSGGSASGLVAWGGDGSTAGAGGNVSVASSGQIHTTGVRAFGMFAQSVGGGGGSGGSGGGLVGLGSTGSAGGSGGAVSAANGGLIDTTGKGSIGVFAQSIGGGGGDGGSGSGLVGIGGSGSGTSAGGAATATNSGSVKTHGDNAQGVFAQSIGGGGGNGGSSAGLVSIGGSGGGGGAGGAVTASNTGSIETFGANAQGLFAQSVGGGGGNGGNAASGGLFASVAIGGSGGDGGAAGSVTVSNGVSATSPNGSIVTHGARSDGIFAQAVGGGGGNGGYAVAASVGVSASASVAVGGSGGVGGAGGAVDIHNKGLIVTNGDDSLGINAQSVGGGGGNGGFAIALAGSNDLALTAAVGGSAGQGAAGGQVGVTSWTDIETSGQRSHGANAQSVGGGGGNGGFSISAAAGGGLAAALGLGGSAGGGGDAGATALTSEGDVTTRGDLAHGLISQSIGGGGGTGGFTVAGSVSATGALSVGIGGKGGSGGAGSRATLSSNGFIETFGASSYGLLAQSVGGGGGAGGFSGSIAGGVSAGGIALGFGGAGNAGGSGGTVNLSGLGGALTHGEASVAILAQSVGGGGGAGGFAASASGGRYGAISLSMGGGAGVGGVGGAVTLSNVGLVGTTGDLAHGVLAQSVGGGGGTGGLAFSGTLSTGTGALAVGLGGNGGSGGDGGAVHLTQGGDVETLGDSAMAVFAQSVGGGGGAGGYAGALAINPNNVAAALSLGGKGLTGGNGGSVELDLTGDATTGGNQSIAVLAQSVGGGGGVGGYAGSAGASGGFDLAAAFGGQSGSGGDGGFVDLSHAGDVLTRGEFAHGVVAQSVGGGGGAGAYAIGGSLSANSYAVGFGRGSPGAVGGVSGDVQLVHGGNVETQGLASKGVFAQSVGGGGGVGGVGVSVAATVAKPSFYAVIGGADGASGGAAGDVALTNTGTVLTHADLANGVLAQSIGGGGGDGAFGASLALASGFSWGLSMGGDGGDGGTSGAVKLNQTGAVETHGALAHAIEAQSVGGGGGNGGFAVSLVGSGQGSSLNFTMGGSGGSGGDAGAVDLIASGGARTFGDNAIGVFAQSVGGGGGSGGFAGGLTAGPGAGALNMTLGGNGGDGGIGRDVTLASTGLVSTSGDNATAVLAQSVGGGGGNGGFSLSAAGGSQTSIALSLGGFGGDGGTSGDVVVDQIGDLITRGNLAYGVLSQSVAGGGGNGGFSVSGSLATSAGAVSASLGGFGGKGDTAGDASVDLNGSVQTEGLGSHAVFAQSVGGGGGSGGFSGAVALAYSPASSNTLALSMGGIGGEGGDAGHVQVTTAAGKTALTKADGAHGVLAQSIGGGGGDGGFSFSGSFGYGAKTAVGLSASLGGIGGVGGKGGDVDVDSHFNIFTLARKAIGILAQSVGGGGGTGGVSASGAVEAGPNSTQGSVAVGGFGGSGGHGGAVKVANAGQIVTKGDGSDGVFAQSVGGGGGDGGLSFAGTFSGNNATGVAVSVGGSGGAAGNGGKVAVTNSGLVDVAGDNATAIFAQSVGGGGGRGGFAIGAGLSVGGEGTNLNLGVTVGGQGGAGGTGDAVDVVNSGRITAHGQGGAGVYAQSVGGGGGAGGGAFTGVVGISANSGANPKARTVNANVTVGGGGGDGNHGGKVTVANSGSIDTFGDDGYGVFAQSIGGGGGLGGTVNAMSLILGAPCSTPPATPGDDPTGCGKNDPAANNWNLAVVVGGDGGGASNGGQVAVTNSGAIHTRGVTADGILAQSVGGGGGIGGTGVLGLAGYTDIPVALLVKPIDKAKFFQNLTVGVGGKGGSSGDGAAVSVNNTGAIVTEGLGSNGIFAQSVGGGGGRGGPAAPGAAGKVGIGGEAGAAGNGGNVTVANTGRIETFGNGANGIFAQSVGGGGGVGGDVQRGVPSGVTVAGVSVKNVGIGLAFGGNGGGGGNGGVVSVTGTGDIVTHGSGASGIFAQSVGGGGGLLGDLGNDLPILNLLNFAGSVGDAGSAKAVTVSAGNITTTGVGSHGVFAQSVGGQGTGANVSVTVSGQVRVQGERSDGLLLQSTGLSGSGALSVNILAGGLVQGGSGPSAGVRLYDGRANSIVSRGTITTVAGLDGLAVDTTGGADALDNFGLIIGSVNLGGGADSFRNRATGEVRSGSAITLGAGEIFTNDGLLNPGGAGLVRTTVLTGAYVQSSTANYRVDLDLDRTGLSGEADRLDVSGSAVVGGKVTARVLNRADALPGDHTVAIVSAAGTQTHAGLTLDAPISAIAAFDLRSPDAKTIQLGYTIDYSPDGDFTDNQRAVGEHINSIQTLGGTPAFRPVAEALFDVPDTRTLAPLYDQMAPLQQLNGAIASLNASRAFVDQMFSCTAPGGQAMIHAQASCGWMRVDARDYEADADAQRLAWEETASSVSGGLDVPLGNLRIGGALAYERSHLGMDNLSRSNGDRFQGGLSLKTQFDRTELGAALTMGRGRYDTVRQLSFPAPALAFSQQDSWFEALSIRGARVFGDKTWFKPSVELTGARVRTDAFSETGAGPLNIQAQAQSADFWRAKAAVEVGGQWEVKPDVWLRPSLKVGVSQKVSGDDWALTSSFEGAPSGSAPFTIAQRADKTLGEVNAAVDLVSPDLISAKLGYTGRFGDNTREQSAYMKFTFRF